MVGLKDIKILDCMFLQVLESGMHENCCLIVAWNEECVYKTRSLASPLSI